MKLLMCTGRTKYPAIAQAVAALDARQAYLDGELCGVGPDGTTSGGCQDVGREFKRPPIGNTR